MNINIPIYHLLTDQGGQVQMITDRVTNLDVEMVEQLRNREVDSLDMEDFSFIKAFGVIDGGKTKAAK